MHASLYVIHLYPTQSTDPNLKYTSVSYDNGDPLNLKPGPWISACNGCDFPAFFEFICIMSSYYNDLKLCNKKPHNIVQACCSSDDTAIIL